MTIEQEIFGRYRLSPLKLTEYGFIEGTHTVKSPQAVVQSLPALILERPIVQGDFIARIVVPGSGSAKRSEVYGVVMDAFTEEEYLPLRVEAQIGAFVGQVREEYRALLEDVAEKCGTEVPFLFDQSNRIAALIEERYGDEPVFLFSKNPGFGIFRHKESERWYAALMNVPENKFNPKGTDEIREIVNLKIDPDTLDSLLEVPGIYRCYHMNKKQWVSVALDGRLTDDDLMEMIETSHRLTDKKSPVTRRKKNDSSDDDGGPAYWIIPANPANYDIVAGFENAPGHTLTWHQRIGASAGDIVYIYHTAPVAALACRCEVVESNLENPYPGFSAKRAMKLRLTRWYDKGQYPRSFLNEHGIAKTVRGQRRAPLELVEALE